MRAAETLIGAGHGEEKWKMALEKLSALGLDINADAVIWCSKGRMVQAQFAADFGGYQGTGEEWSRIKRLKSASCFIFLSLA